MKHSFACVILSAVALLAIPNAGTATIFVVQREVDYDIHFSGPNFANASVNVLGTFTIGPGSSGTEVKSGGYPSLNQGITFFGTGGVSISPVSVPAGTTSVDNVLTVTGPGTYGFQEAFPPASSYFDTGFLSPLGVYPVNGFPNLELFSPSSGLLDTGGTWITKIYFPGDWSQSSAGDVSGTHTLLSLDPLWSISSNFVYDPGINKTLFSVINTNYPGELSDDSAPYPDVALIGSPVPEPSTGLVLASALVVLAIGRRRLRITAQR